MNIFSASNGFAMNPFIPTFCVIAISSSKAFAYKGKEHQFYIFLGYAEYPTFASNRSQLMRCADAALYEIKLHGKNGCMAYKEGLELRARKQLGFAFKDISENLPGAFIIYRADKEDRSKHLETD